MRHSAPLSTLEEWFSSKEGESSVPIMFSICVCSVDTLTSLLHPFSPVWNLPKTSLSSQNRIFNSLKCSVGNGLITEKP